ncbi:MAG: glycine dehydrogenase (aminomethyl-transferring) [Comamonadaceae bacterium CG12_big_fil_rev_8_21_14_0_65_59_15]|nr:MAG: glycine dehydrogenase (aminomethyl-transferring) [Comamonadaceae bacterium CG12_big_fil_rev_8_21_14_0_65_59_15]
MPTPTLSALENASEFSARHIGVSAADEAVMLKAVQAKSRAALIKQIVPRAIARKQPMAIPPAIPEAAALAELKAIASKNKVLKSCIGQGYYDTFTPGVILRNILENPAWYTAYTPYQAEISQGRMEALVNFQTMIMDLTGMPMANASMLDEATAAAEAMTLARRVSKSASKRFLVDAEVLPQTLAVIRTRAQPLDIDVVVCAADQLAAQDGFAVLLQYPGTSGVLRDDRALITAVKAKGAAVIMAADLLALTVLTPPGELGADIAIGSTQRFGCPMGNGGPHAAYMACLDAHKRAMPGRLVGVSIDAHGNPAYRLALQTREQHIRREKATSNICTAQVLPAVVASMYAVYHGPDGLQRIAQRVHQYACVLAASLQSLGYKLTSSTFFDTLTVSVAKPAAVIKIALAQGINLRQSSASTVSLSLDETTTRADVALLWSIFAQPAVCPKQRVRKPDFDALAASVASAIPSALQRRSRYLQHPVFNSYHSETGMLRYIRRLSDFDLALDRSMIPLGSCTMKLNATSEMLPITWPEFAQIHPFAPAEQRAGYALLDVQLRAWLCQATGYAGISLQPNAGSQGEYAGMMAIRGYHLSRKQPQRNICLIPSSAHGTNPASATMAGFKVVVTACDANGNVDMADLKAKCEEHSANLGAMMITYPSTHGVFEVQVKDLCALVHKHGGRVYVDGANMNALVGLAAPGEFGGDVSHLNLHKTFCIPHGGGGPGVGPVCVVQDLVPFLPGKGVGAVSAAPLGNASVLPISWMYCRMMGAAGLQAATEVAILSANYISARLAPYYPTLYTSVPVEGQPGRVAHECILDVRPLKDRTGVGAEDVTKRLMDYGFHAPTLSFPVPGTLMVEPTESETLQELERFIDAMIAIRGEIARVESGEWPRDNNPLVNAPHTAASLLESEWSKPYSRGLAAFPVPDLKASKYWPPVGRIDNVYGDRNLACACIAVGE